MTTLDAYNDLPSELQPHLSEIEMFIADVDGKTIGTPTADGEAFMDDGTVDAEGAVKAFNAIVAFVRNAR
jgi:hypothetical protein